MLYSAPLSMTVGDSSQKEHPVSVDGYLIPVSNKTENISIPRPVLNVEFDDDIYMKSIQNHLALTSEQCDINMQKCPSHHEIKATIPHNDSVNKQN